MKRLLLAAAIACALTLLARAQPATISGRVVADETGDPIANARVSIASAARPTQVVLTDSNGRFVVPAPADRTSVTASKSGYARRLATPAGDGQAIEIRLVRGAVISGQVVDRYGDPVPAARVVAYTRSGSSAELVTVQTAETDDRGEYRLPGLSAGAYLVGVTTIGSAMVTVVVASNVRAVTPAPQRTFYPGVDAPDEAEALRIQPGEDRSAIDLVVTAEQTLGNPFTVIRFVPGPLAQPQSPDPRASGIVRGQVVSTDLRALPFAQVRFVPSTGLLQSRMVTADRDGRFEFTELPAGKYRFVASKTGYAPVEDNKATMAGLPFLSGGRAIDLAEGETRERVDITLVRWGTLAGRVFDELGDPLQGASVQVLQVRYQAGRRRLAPAGSAARVTDDLGRYRLYALPPGQYVVSASVSEVGAADLPGYTRSYYPGTPNAGAAQFVSVGTSQDVVGIDVPLSRTTTVLVAGKVLNAAGEPTTAGSLRLMPSRRSTSLVSMPAGARVLPDGAFEFPNVAPGQYVIQADRGRSNSWTEGEFGTMPVSVSGTDVTGLVLQTSTGSFIKGRITFDTFNGSKTPAPSSIELAPLPVDFDLAPASVATADIHDNWTFDMVGVNGPRRLQLRRAPAGWALKEIRVNRIDATDRPLPFGRKEQSLSDVEVVLTDRVNELNGKVADDRARPVPGSVLIVFSTDRDRWYPASRFLRKTTAGSDGAFTMTGLPFGSYYAIALAQLSPEGPEGDDGWQDPQFLESLIARASSVTLSDGQKTSLNLRVTAR